LELTGTADSPEQATDPLSRNLAEVPSLLSAAVHLAVGHVAARRSAPASRRLEGFSGEIEPVG
jgi:hypothetical protein